MKFKTLMVATLLKTTAEQVFSCEFRQIFKNSFFTECLLTTAFDIVHLISLFYFCFKLQVGGVKVQIVFSFVCTFIFVSFSSHMVTLQTS